MSKKAEESARKIMLLFEPGGIAPLPADKFAQVQENVGSILLRAMESLGEKKARKWRDWQRVKTERQGAR